ncbi:serine/threonine-protein kinase [Umezawaea tangerina]|uniref:non-specific serine/threonine protein kinase n=1 Tax=Umezawaea tangerina TaxID=84725 RepID=A0A2T0SQV8_9PSEU|nr:serine/threonine-protein kinase [Umezawaea tangerina]PRY35789.1 serine/threonine protein kinase [Umezawaea tangerina]
MPERDEVVAGRYRLVEPLGRGAAGVVWRAQDERLARVVAVKFFTSAGSPKDVDRIVREGRIAARLRHPHAVTVHDVVEHGGKPCLVMEYVPSKTLAEMMDAAGALPEALVVGVGWQVASALAAAHAAGIVHRDVTPFNVLVGDDGTAKVVDFGISRAVGEGTVTEARAVIGTPAYLAPEVASGHGAVFASDVYALGATLYAALEGHPPFGNADDNPYALLRRVAEGQVAPPRFPGPLGEVLGRVLRRDPAERPTMAETYALLDAAVQGLPLPAAAPPTATATATHVDTRPVEDTGPVGHAPPTGGTQSLPVPRRVPWKKVAVVAGAAALVAVGVVVGTSLRDERPADTALPAQDSTSTTTSTTTSSTTPPAPDCAARLEVTNAWPDGYQAQVVVRNASGRALTGWKLTWPQPAANAINNLWNGVLTKGADSVTVTSADYNAALPVDGSTTLGFTANGPATEPPDVTCTSGG